jgi:hypothetical protein
LPLTPDQIRAALADLNGQRDVRIEFEHASTCIVQRALLVPAEQDNIVKLTDGAREYLLVADRIAWMEIG